MKKSQLALIAVAVIAVALIAILGSGGGDDDTASNGNGNGNGTATAPSKAPAGATTVTFAYSPEKEKLLVPLVNRFNASNPEANGKKVFVRAQNVSSGDAQTKIAAGRLKLTAWSPSSSMWGGLLNFEADQPYAPESSPSIVRTPLVIAMWEPMAKALGYPKRKIGFADILKLARSNQGWAAFGRPEFGQFKLVHTNPDFSTSGPVGGRRGVLLGDRQEGGPADGRHQARPRAGQGHRALDRALRRHDAVHLRRAAQARPRLRVGGRDGGGDARRLQPAPRQPRQAHRDLSLGGHVLLRQPVHHARRAVGDRRPAQAGAASFQKFLEENIDAGMAARYGFRPADLDAKPADPLNAANGVDPKQPTRVLGVPQPRVLSAVKDAWRADRKPANVLLVLDTSGSMNDEGRLPSAKDGLQTFLKEVAPQDRVGLTIFNDRVTEVAPITPMREIRASLRGVISRLIADGGTAIYDATDAGVATVKKLADTSRINAVVLLTDGEDTDSSKSRRRGRARARRAGRLVAPRARVHDRLLGRRGGRRPEARAHRAGVGRQGLRGQHRRHRVGLPQHQLVLLSGPGELAGETALQPRRVRGRARRQRGGQAVQHRAAGRHDGRRGARRRRASRVALLVALVVYAIAVARTFFDEDEAEAVLTRERAERRAALKAGTRQLDPGTLAPEVRRHLLDARAIEERIRDAIERAELPYEEVSTEVDALVSLMELSASRAQLLYEALEDSPPSRVAGRLRELEGSGKTELIEALEHQLTVQRKMEAQLESFYDQMERIAVELDSIRGRC